MLSKAKNSKSLLFLRENVKNFFAFKLIYIILEVVGDKNRDALAAGRLAPILSQQGGICHGNKEKKVDC